MLRTQIQLDAKYLRLLKKRAREEGVSVAEMVRRCVAQFFEKEAPDRSLLYARASSLVGAFSDREGAGDVAVNHDRYLDDAFR